MTRSRLAAVAAALALFGVFLLLLFPTDAIVRSVLARATPPGWPGMTFEHAALRPDGIVLDTVTLQSAPDAPLLAADRLRLRPSWGSLVRGGTGSPWGLAADLCHGKADGDVTADGAGSTVAFAWHDLELSACPKLRIAGGTLEGRADGDAHLRLSPTAPAEGTGTIALRDALWQGMGRLAIIGTVHAATATIRWRLGDGTLTLEAVDLNGPEVTVTGGGEVALADPLPASRLDLTLDITPAREAPGRIRFFLGIEKDATVTRHLTLGGTLAAPLAQLE